MKRFGKVWMLCELGILLYIGILLVLRSGIVASPARRIQGIENEGISFEELRIPEGTEVIGIGEATHGNCEFQSIKLEMLKKLVESGKCRSIAFEITAGEGAEINDAIHREDVDLTELMGRGDYPLYDTAQIVELLSWMREYNKSVSYEESLRFYGVDMQGPEREVRYLAGFAEAHKEAVSESEGALLREMAEDEDYDFTLQREFFVALEQKLAGQEDAECRYAAVLAGVVLQWIDAPRFNEDPNAYGEHRDLCMAKNLKRYHELEEERGCTQILISAHNGHVMKGETEGYGEVTMGSRIDELFEGRYFCVGTGFYTATVNIHTAGTYDEEYERLDHSYCSDDILAYQARYFEGERYCLEFAGIKDEKLKQLVHSKNFMGIVGEGYSRMSDISRGYRMRLVVADRFDAVVYYYKVTPIRTIHY